MMATTRERFKVLLCGRKELMDGVRKTILRSEDIHLQFTSAPHFMMSRAMFNVPDAVLIDASYDRTLLQDVLRTFRSHFENLALFPVATTPDHHHVVDLMKHGATGYFVIPKDLRRLGDQISQLLDRWKTDRAQQRFVQLQQRAFDFKQIIGTSPRLLETLHHAKKIIENTSLTVLITGETGTGKELLARAIHYNSTNGGKPFVDIGCSALPESLLESELFGFEKGAFTDARERKQGLFELAGEGTIFLDEIGDITPAMQSKLLKVIESRMMRRLGGVHDIPVKARIIAATSVDLDAKIKAGSFRIDLYHRLKIIPLVIPPLRDRAGDIPLLVDTFIDLFNKIYNKRIEGVTPEAMAILNAYTWEGNIRELKHCIERAVLLREKGNLDSVDFQHLPQVAIPRVSHPTELVSGEREQSDELKKLTLELFLPDVALDDVQRLLAQKVLNHVGGNKSRAAFLMRISRPRLDRILRNGQSDE